eukprot:COSAG02_NODE_2317_length_9151_cov_5.534909_2_plen_553_part_00
MVEGEAPAAKKRRGRRVKVQGVFHASAARHRMAWGTEKGPQTEKEKQAAKRLVAEQRAAADLIAQTAQSLERDYGVSSPGRDSRLEQRLKVEATSAKGALRFRNAIDGARGTRVLGYYDGTPWLLVRDEEERREFFYNPGAREATWEEPPELQAEKHTGSTDSERASAANRAITSITRSMRGRTKRRRQILAAYAKCVKRLSGGYPDYVNRRLCFVEDIITASMTGLVAVLAYMRSEGVANIWVGAGVQTSRERHGDDWHGGSDAIRGSAGIPVDLILLILTCGSKILLCLGPQDGGAQAVAQMCCNIDFQPLPGHARQLQQLFQAIAFCALSVLSLGLPFFCFVWTFSFSLWLLIAGFFKFDPIWIVAGYAAEKEVAWLTPPPRFCKPLARNLASIQYGFGGATLVWAGVDGERGLLRPPTRTSVRCRCLHRRAADAAEKYQHGGLPMPGLDDESDSDVDAEAAAGGPQPEQIQDVGSDEDEGKGADLVHDAHSDGADDKTGGHNGPVPDAGDASDSSLDVASSAAPPGASTSSRDTSAETEEAAVSDMRS